MLELTEYEEKLISAVLAQMRIDIEEFKVKNDYAIIMNCLATRAILTEAMNRIE